MIKNQGLFEKYLGLDERDHNLPPVSTTHPIWSHHPIHSLQWFTVSSSRDNGNAMANFSPLYLARPLARIFLKRFCSASHARLPIAHVITLFLSFSLLNWSKYDHRILEYLNDDNCQILRLS